MDADGNVSTSLCQPALACLLLTQTRSPPTTEQVFHEFTFFAAAGFPMHRTGMLDAALLAWQHGNGCAAALSCLWHNRISQHSMRMQLNFNFVASMAGLTEHVQFLDRDEGRALDDTYEDLAHMQTFDLRSTGWPRWGRAAPDQLPW